MCFPCLLLVRNRSALVCELLSNNSLLDGLLYKDKSLVLHAHDNLPPNSELLHNNSLLELIYFLNNQQFQLIITTLLIVDIKIF